MSGLISGIIVLISTFVNNSITKTTETITTFSTLTPTHFLLDSAGYRGWQETLGVRSIVQIENVTEEGQGYKTLRLIKPEGFVFQPGQYLEIRSGGVMSTASQKSPAVLAIASGSEDEMLEVTARGSAKPWHPNHCLNRRPGASLEIVGPLGTPFPLELVTPETPLLLLGGGSGLTVIRSLYHSMPEGVTPQILFSAQTEDSLFYRTEIDRWREEGHFVSLTRETRDGYERRRITDRIAEMEISANTLAFICGPIPLIHATIQSLVEKGLPATQIFVSLPFGAKQGGPVYRADHPRVNRVRPRAPVFPTSSSSSR